MSESTSPKTASPANTDAAAGQNNDWDLGRRRTNLPFVPLSLLLHALLPVVLMLFTAPGRELLLGQVDQDPEVAMAADRLEEIVEQLDEVNEEYLEERVEQLDEILLEMDHVEQMRLEEFDLLAEELAETALEDALAAQEEALAAQEDTIEQQTQADTAAEDDPASNELGKALEEVLQTQTRVMDAQAKARRALKMAKTSLSDVAAAQAAAEQAQDRADAAQVAARQAQSQLNTTAGEAEKTGRIAKSADNRLNSTQEKLAQALQRVEKNDTQQTEKQQQIAEARTAASKAQTDTATTAEQLSEARQKHAEDPSRENQRAMSQAERDANTAAGRARKAAETVHARESELGRLEKAGEHLASEAEKATADAAKAEQNQQETAAAAATAQGAADAAMQDFASKQSKARTAQREAHESQQKAHEQLKRAVGAGVEVAQSEQSDLTEQTANEPGPAADASLAGLYSRAVATENTITQKYRNARAAELATVRGIPLDEATGKIDVAQPERPPLDQAALDGAVRTGGQLQRHKEEMRTAIRQVDSMVSSGRNMLAVARGDSVEPNVGTEITLEDLHARSDLADQLAAAAAENTSARASDLSDLMRAAATADTQAVAPGDGDGREQPGSSQGPSTSSGNSGTAVAGRSGGGVGRGGGGVPQVNPKLRFLPGRRVAADGVPSKWMFVDSWYVLGPFPNPGRKNRDHKFPPETLVDLDATYEGKDGQPIRWEHMQGGTFPLKPPHMESYAIYYAWTQIEFDQPMDLWVAVGSDDKSTLWINDYPVWISGDQHKSWQIAEGYRKVHFKSGRNDVLFRVENGHGACAFSLLICVDPQRR